MNFVSLDDIAHGGDTFSFFFLGYILRGFYCFFVGGVAQFSELLKYNVSECNLKGPGEQREYVIKIYSLSRISGVNFDLYIISIFFALVILLNITVKNILKTTCLFPAFLPTFLAFLSLLSSFLSIDSLKKTNKQIKRFG